MGFLGDQKTRLTEAALKNEKVSFFRDRIWPELEKFLIAGPALIGFIIGLWRYAPGTRHFETAFQSLVFFSGYMLGMILLQTLDSLFLSSRPMVLGIGRSLLALLYLGLTMKQYLESRSGEVRILGFTTKCRNRVGLSPA